MTLSHDRSGELHENQEPVFDYRHARRRHRAVLPVEDLHKGVAGSKLVIVEEGGLILTAVIGRSGTRSWTPSCANKRAKRDARSEDSRSAR